MAAKILCGPKDTSEIPNIHFGKLLQDVLTSHDRNKLAVVDVKSGTFYTYGDLCDFSQNLASNLKNIGVEKDCVIGLISENSKKMCVVYLAALSLMAPVHLLSSKYTEYELQELLKLSRPVLVFASRRSLGSLLKVRENLKFLQTIVLLDKASDNEVCLLYDNLIKQTIHNVRFDETVDPKTQTAIICNSSGTTGLPKGVMLTHEGLRSHLQLIRSGVINLTPTENVPVVLPMVHIFGIIIMNCVFYSGATLLVIDQFHPENYLRTIEKYKVKRLFLVPYLVNFLSSCFATDRYDLSSLTGIYAGGSTTLEEEKKKLKTKLNLTEIYGLTEASSIVVATPRNGFCPVGSCGKLVSGRELKIRHVDTHLSLGPCETGEICVRNCNMKGYINDSVNTRKSFDAEGFLLTGDLGYYDEQGFIYITGRLKNIIKYKSFQVPPEQLEIILVQHPLIKDAAVVGQADRKFGEVAVGFIVKEEGADLTDEEVAKYLAKMVSSEKWLHGGIRFVMDIPRNAIGKIMRGELQQLLQ